MDSDRLIIARTHMGQKIPVLNPDPPLLQTGAEYIVPQITSSKFAHRALKDGTIIKLEKDKFITVKYNDGTIETFDIIPRYSSTKRSSTIRITLTTLEVGDTFKQNQLVAWSKSFSDNVLSIGKNKKVAVLNYIGHSHEDGYVISEDMSNDFKTEFVIKLPVIIPPNTKILFFTENNNTLLNDTLIEFQYRDNPDVDNYLNTYDLIESEFQENIKDFYQSTTDSIKIKSPGGEIVDIKIRLNNRLTTDPVLLNKWDDQVNTIRDIEKELNKNLIKDKKLLDNIDTSVMKLGGHKLKGKDFEGCLIEFYINIVKKTTIGDKISNRFGAKGVVNHIIPSELCPKGEYSGDIDLFLAPAAILGRKNTVILKELYIGKIVVNLKNIVMKDIANGKFESAKEKIIYTYSILDRTGRQAEIVTTYLNSINMEDFKIKLDDPKYHFNFIIPPFNVVKFEDIRTVAAKLKIPLDEKVYIEELKNWTKTPVPVGYTYISAMEQLSSDYESTRARAGYVSATGQPVKRKSQMGGQNLGNLDIYNLLTYDCNHMMTELMTVRSDNMKAKNEVISNIMQYGQSNIPHEIKKGKTQDLFKTMMLSIGLDIKGVF